MCEVWGCGFTGEILKLFGLKNNGSDKLLAAIKNGERLTFGEQLYLTMMLSIPAIFAQVSSIVMQYIDASMVGSLGADASGAIGLVSTTTWLFGGTCVAVTTGFSVQIAQAIGAGKDREARDIMKQGIIIALCYSIMLLLIAVSIHKSLPGWLGGAAGIREMAGRYFFIYMLAVPASMMNGIAGGMLQCSGNMRVPSILNIMMCFLDVVFNWFFIFPDRSLNIFGRVYTVPGMGLGVDGAALGTALAQVITAVLMLSLLLFGKSVLRLHAGEGIRFFKQHIKRAVKIAVPVGVEQIVMCSAYVMSTKIVSPLGTIAIAAHSFAITAESLCYMPGYGIQAAATTLVGQSVGAGRRYLSRHMAWLTVGLGVMMMSIGAVIMYFAAPAMIGVLTPDPRIRELGTMVLRIEVFAEPFYALSIVASGALRGAGDTLIPSCVNFVSMWLVRIPLSALLAPSMGLKGVWLAMCIELCVRGVLYFIRLKRGKWLKIE